MFREVKIGDKSVPMLAMASANIYYKRVFGRDAIVAQADAATDGERIAFYGEMGFIMAQMAKAKGDRKALLALNEERYIEWLEQFDASAYNAAIAKIAMVYEGQLSTDSEAKKE